MSIERVETGIKALDEALEGGFPKGSWVVVGGKPGTGKTILALHFAGKGLENGEKVIYVTTEQEFDDIIRQARQFNIRFDEASILNLNEVISYDSVKKEYVFKEVGRLPQLVVVDLFALRKAGRYFSQELSEEGSKKVLSPTSIEVLTRALDTIYRDILQVESRREHIRLVIDSMSVFWAHAPAIARRISYNFKLAYHRPNITTLLTSQYAMTTRGIFGFGIEHIADVVIETVMPDAIEIARTGSTTIRWVILKARMTNLTKRVFEVSFERTSQNISRLVLKPIA